MWSMWNAPSDRDYYGDWAEPEPDEDDEPVCVCEEYEGATHPVFCRACNMYTDDKELLMAEPEPVKMAAVVEQMLVNTNRVMAAVYRAMDKKEVA